MAYPCLTVADMTKREVRLLAEARAACASGEAAALRKRLGLPLEFIATEVGVSAVSVWRWETGSHLPTGDRAVRLGRTLARLRRLPVAA
jgi:DNA-binding transcriptional regulator YiaG